MSEQERRRGARTWLPIAAALIVGSVTTACWVFDNPIDPAYVASQSATSGSKSSSSASGAGGGVSFDTTPPVPGSGGSISGVMPGPDSFIISWTAATDNSTASSKLEYEVVGGTTPITTLAQAEASPVLVPWTANETSTTITFPTWDTVAGPGAHYVDVLVRDLAGNIANYTTGSRKLYLYDIAAEVADNSGTAAAGTHIFLNDGNGNFRIPTNAQGGVYGTATSGYSDLALGNLTGHAPPADGGPPIDDIFVTNFNVSPNEVWQNTGSTAAQLSETDASWLAGPWSSVALGDVTGNGYLDAVVSGYGTSNVVWDNTSGTGSFSSGDPNNIGALGSMSGYFTHAFLGHLVSNGTPTDDLFLTSDGNGSGAANQFWTNSAGTLSQVTGSVVFSTTISTTTNAALADVNNSGTDDVIFVTNNGSVNRAWANNGMGSTGTSLTLMSQPNFPSADPSTGVALGDLNRDGFTDALVINDGAPPEVWLNDGSAVFVQASVPAFAGLADQETGVALQDLNGDGILDAVISSGGPTGSIRVFLGKGDGTFTEVPEPNIPTGNYVAVAIGRLR